MKKLINYYKNISKTTKIHLLILILFCLIQVLVITRFNYIFGSNVDWMKQHIMFPDYFRNLFYETGNLFPEFSLHLGSGQNIFYFAYYGLFSPVIMLSYLFPFISMGTYIMISSILIIIISVILLYYFLRRNHFSNNICFITSLFFLFSSSFIFHSHRHIMFVSYIPFLILSLIGVIKYYEKNKSFLLIISVFLMILTSYYYSVPGLIAICLYSLYYYLNIFKDKNIIFFIKKFTSFVFRILVGILLSSFLLLPVVYVILNGRNGGGLNISINQLLPSIDLDYLIYGTYSVGLTSILWISLLYGFIYLKKEYKVICLILSIICFIPIFNLLLNGGLYLNGKIFIPFIPLFLFLIASMIKDIRISKKSLIWLVFSVILSIIFIKLNNREIYFYIELFVTLFILCLFRKKNKYYYFIPIIIFSFIISCANSINDDLVSINDYKKQLSYFNYDVNKYINIDTNFIYRYQDNLSNANSLNFSYGKLDYRTTLYSSTSNLNYLNSFYNTFNNNDKYRNCFMLNQTNNLFFNNYMGIRYLLTDNDSPYGYNKIKEYDKGSLYENTNVYPIGFSSNHLLNIDEYNNLSFIEKILAYQKNIIVSKDSSNSILDSSYESINLDYDIREINDVLIENNDNHYKIKVMKYGKILLDLKESISNKTLIIRFNMNNIPSCKNGDTYITINGIKNLLTCGSWKYFNNNITFDYTISSNEDINSLLIEFSKGNYDISEIETYLVDNSFFDNNDINPLTINNDNKNSVLEGIINQQEDGYFIFTIPYDNGFKVYVDNKLVEIEKVNNGFIGFNITKGNHLIRLEFDAPYFNLGKLITIVMIFMTFGVVIYERKNSK